MENMGYCMFENTLAALRECDDALYSISLDDLSEREKRAAKQLLDLCRKMGELLCEGDKDAQIHTTMASPLQLAA